MPTAVKQPRKEDIQAANAIDDLSLIGEIGANTRTKLDKLLDSTELLISRMDKIRTPASDKACSTLCKIYSATRRYSDFIENNTVFPPKAFYELTDSEEFMKVILPALKNQLRELLLPKEEASGIRKDIGKQQEKMKPLFDELKRTVSKSKEWDSVKRDSFMGVKSPLEFFTGLSKKLKEEGVDEMDFADFIMLEVETPLRLAIREGMKAWKIDAESELRKTVKKRFGDVVEEKLGGLNEKELGKITDKEIDSKIRDATRDEKLAARLVTIAKCIEDAASQKVSVAKLFELHNEWQVAETNRDMANEYVRQIRKSEMDLAFPRRNVGWDL